MKRAVFLHGTDGHPSDHWWPWLKTEFEKSGYQVWAPTLPDNHTPNDDVYYEFLTSQNWDFTDNVIVGHSSGATTVLNLLSRKDFPVINTAVLAGVFLSQSLTSKNEAFKEENQFVNLFPVNGFNWSYIKNKAEKFYFIHGDDDPYCSYDEALEACTKVNGKMITIPHGGHLSSRFGVTKLPGLIAKLNADSVL